MTTPSPADVWREVYVSAGDATPAIRACVSAAFRIADQVWRQVHTDPGLTADFRRRMVGDDRWATTALAAYQHLMMDGAYNHLDRPAPPICRAHANALVAWLNGPSPLPGFDTMTVADTWGINDIDFDAEAEDVATTIETLVHQAQSTDLFGVPGYTIAVRRILSDDHRGNTFLEHQVTLLTPAGAVLASAPIATDHLTDGLSGVDAAVAVLTNMAAYVSELLADEARIVHAAYDPVRHHIAAPALGGAHRGFRSLDLSDAVGRLPALGSPAQPAADRRPHR